MNDFNQDRSSMPEDDRADDLHDPGLENLLRESVQREFEPWFSRRVIQRLREKESRSGGFELSLGWAFRRLALPAAALILALAVWNLNQGELARDGNAYERLLALPSQTVAASIEYLTGV